MLQFAMFLVLWAPPQSTDAGVQTAKDLASQITEKLRQHNKSGTLAETEVDISVRKKIVTVSGKVTSRQQARVIVDAICDVDGFEGIQLNLGIKQPPSSDVSRLVSPFSALSPWPTYPYPNYASTAHATPPGKRAFHRVELKWDDGWWQLDFEGDQQVSKVRFGESTPSDDSDTKH